MITQTYDATTLKGYLDGNLVASENMSGNGSAGAPNLFRIGGSISGFISAYIDDVSYFTDALTASEVQTLYSDGGSFLLNMI
jgi:hypothetical protein